MPAPRLLFSCSLCCPPPCPPAHPSLPPSPRAPPGFSLLVPWHSRRAACCPPSACPCISPPHWRTPSKLPRGISYLLEGSPISSCNCVWRENPIHGSEFVVTRVWQVLENKPSGATPSDRGGAEHGTEEMINPCPLCLPTLPSCHLFSRALENTNPSQVALTARTARRPPSCSAVRSG